MQTTSVRVVVSSSSGRQREATITLETLNPAERTRRALKFLGACWLGAVVAVFIPILHFVLVPLLLLVGPLWAYHIQQQESRIAGGQGTCPDCNATFAIEKGAAKWPCEEPCSSCRTMLKINLP